MSHFVVIVIGDDIEAQLAPFQENNMGDCPKEYLKFDDQTDEYRREYEEDSSSQVRIEDGTYLSKYDERFRNPLGVLALPQYVVPPPLEEVERPHKEMYPTFEAFMAEWTEMKPNDEGRYGWEENPNCKWDYWRVGGRWSGRFPILANAAPGTFGSQEVRALPANPMGFQRSMQREEQQKRYHNEQEMCADWAIKSVIDIERWKDKAEGHARKAWTYWEEALAFGGPKPESWTTLRERHGEDRQAARKEYKEQPAIIAWEAAYTNRGEHAPFGVNPVEEYGFDLDKHVARMRHVTTIPHAFLHNGEWQECGEMGWFGCVSNEMDKNEWVEKWEALMKSLPDDTRLTCVDCHI